MVFAVNNFDEKFATLDAKMSDLKAEYKKVNARIDGEVEVQRDLGEDRGTVRIVLQVGGVVRSWTERDSIFRHLRTGGRMV